MGSARCWRERNAERYGARSDETPRAQPSQPSSLRDRFTNWHRSLPAVSRDRRFSMSEIEAALKTQGKYISPVLLELGWRRKRIWSTSGQYHRYWEPPLHSDLTCMQDRCGRRNSTDPIRATRKPAR